MTHRCSVIGCAAAIPEVQALCRHHWSRVSPATRRAVLSAWRALKRRPGEPPRTAAVILATLTIYCEALSRAVAEAALGGSEIHLPPAAGPAVLRKAGVNNSEDRP